MGNQIQNINVLVASLPDSLRVLRLSNNNISNINLIGEFIKIVPLTHLYLDNNQITSVEALENTVPLSMNLLDISNNPIINRNLLNPNNVVGQVLQGTPTNAGVLVEY